LKASSVKRGVGKRGRGQGAGGREQEGRGQEGTYYAKRDRIVGLVSKRE
jgi:hypothetical protein